MWRRVTRGLVVVTTLVAALVPAAFAQGFVGGVDYPLEGEKNLSGLILVRGWALDERPISRIDLYVDDQYQYSANLGLPRVDVIAAYPNWTGIQTRKPGFIVGFNTGRFSNGPHTIHLQVVTADNKTWEVGRRTVTFDSTINQSPLGVLDIPDGSATFDASGSFPVVGWAADADGVARIDVLIDNLIHQAGVYGDPRPDVGNTFPDVPTAKFSGYIAHIDSTRLTEGIHTLAVRATDRRGFGRIIGTRTIQVFNNENNQKPFGFIDEPIRDQVLYGTCGDIFQEPPPCQVSPCVPFNPENHITPVRGWTLDLGTRTDTGRVSYVELLIDGVRWISSDDCSYNANFGALINCYGMPRFDVARYYPTYPDAPRSGFYFTLDVGALFALGVPPGHHVMKVRVGDQEQTFTDIPATSGIPVFFACAVENGDFPSFGYVDYPGAMEFLGGTVTFAGWALDENDFGIRNVEIYVDGNFMGVARYGGYRVDVQANYPQIQNSLNSGWAFTLDTLQLNDAVHRMTAVAIDQAGRRTEIGSRDFVVDNPR